MEHVEHHDHHQYNIELNGRRAGTLLSFTPPSRSGGDLVISCGAGMSRDFYDWVSSAFSHTHKRNNGAVNPSPSVTAAQRREFVDALIAEVILPALDKSVKIPAAMTVTLSPQLARLNPSPAGWVGTPSKPWFINDFKLQIDGLEAECKQVASVGAVWVRTQIKPYSIGSSRVAEKLPTSDAFSKITITLPAAAYGVFEKWSRDSVNGGISGSKRKGSLEYLSAGGGRPYFHVDFSGLGIVALSHTAKGTTAVELYFGDISFSAQAAALSG